MKVAKTQIAEHVAVLAALPLAVRGAFESLRLHYLSTERPLPISLDSLCRLAGAANQPERAAVREAAALFERRGDALFCPKIERELERHEARCETNKEVAVAREEGRRISRTCHRRAGEQPRHDTCVKRETAPAMNVQDLLSVYSESLPMLPSVSSLDGAELTQARAAWRNVCGGGMPGPKVVRGDAESALDWFQTYFYFAGESDALMGKTTNWRADLAFLVGEGMADVLAGKYHDGLSFGDEVEGATK